MPPVYSSVFVDCQLPEGGECVTWSLTRLQAWRGAWREEGLLGHSVRSILPGRKPRHRLSVWLTVTLPLGLNIRILTQVSLLQPLGQVTLARFSAPRPRSLRHGLWVSPGAIKGLPLPC